MEGLWLLRRAAPPSCSLLLQTLRLGRTVWFRYLVLSARLALEVNHECLLSGKEVFLGL